MSWDRFMRQYDAQGRQKGDGYAPADFAGLSEQELARAREMMFARAMAGDTIDLSGLRHVGDRAIVAALRSAEGTTQRFGWRFDIIRHEVLFDLTGDASELTSLVPYLDGSDDEAQQAAADAFNWHRVPATVEPFLRSRICDGRHEAARLALIQAWIGVRQQAPCDPQCFQRHLAAIRRVSAAPPAQRAALLDAWG